MTAAFISTLSEKRQRNGRRGRPSEPALRALCDVAGLLRVRVCDRVVRQHVERSGQVDRHGDVRIDEGHRGSLWQLLAGDRLELLPRQVLVLGHCYLHAVITESRYPVPRGPVAVDSRRALA